MIGYGGGTTNREQVAQLERAGWGMMIAPQNPKRSTLRYAVDNGAYYSWTRKRLWNVFKFRKMLDRVERFERKPDFGVCPDVVAAGMESLDHSMYWIDLLPKGYPWYLAVQDGMTTCGVLEVLHKFGGIFVGGTSDWKMRTLPQWVHLGRAEGKPVHVGRVNSLPRAFMVAKVCTADSFDGTTWNRTWASRNKPDNVVGDRQLPLDLWGLH